MDQHPDFFIALLGKISKNLYSHKTVQLLILILSQELSLFQRIRRYLLGFLRFLVVRFCKAILSLSFDHPWTPGSLSIKTSRCFSARAPSSEPNFLIFSAANLHRSIPALRSSARRLFNSKCNLPRGSARSSAGQAGKAPPLLHRWGLLLRCQAKFATRTCSKARIGGTWKRPSLPCLAHWPATRWQ